MRLQQQMKDFGCFGISVGIQNQYLPFLFRGICMHISQKICTTSSHEMQTEHVSKDVAISSHLLSSFFAAHIILVMMIPILHYNECFKTMPTRFSCQMSMEPEPNIRYCGDKCINCRLFCCNVYIYYFSKKIKINKLLNIRHLNTFENTSKLIK